MASIPEKSSSFRLTPNSRSNRYCFQVSCFSYALSNSVQIVVTASFFCFLSKNRSSLSSTSCVSRSQQQSVPFVLHFVLAHNFQPHVFYSTELPCDTHADMACRSSLLLSQLFFQQSHASPLKCFPTSSPASLCLTPSDVSESHASCVSVPVPRLHALWLDPIAEGETVSR